MNRQGELLTGAGSGGGKCGAEGSSAIGDGGQAAISLVSDVDDTGSGFLLAFFFSIYPLEKNSPVMSG